MNDVIQVGYTKKTCIEKQMVASLSLKLGI